MFGIRCVSRFEIMGRKKTNLNFQYPTSTSRLNQIWRSSMDKKTKASICQFVFSHILFYFLGECSGFYIWSRLGFWALNAFVREENIHCLQIDSFISYTYYECIYGPEDYRFDHLHKHCFKKGCVARF